MSLFLGLMSVQKMIVAVLPLSLSHVCFKIGNEDIGIPQFKSCCFICLGRAVLHPHQWLKDLFAAVPLPKPEAKISLILFSPDTSSTGFTYRRAHDVSPSNLEADYNQFLKNSRGSRKYLLPTYAAAWGALLVLCLFQPSVEQEPWLSQAPWSSSQGLWPR